MADEQRSSDCCQPAPRASRPCCCGGISATASPCGTQAGEAEARNAQAGEAEASTQPETLGDLRAPWIDGVVHTPIGDVPRAHTRLNARDWAGALRVRSGIFRMSYRVPPGLYALGAPTPSSPVLVSANYKLSFDLLRRRLPGRDAWILVLDTKGVNVWCAAGKGNFGTEELVRRIRLSGLERIVAHRKLIVPQLGATGVSAHRVRELSGFHVIYGPIRARDLPAFLDHGMKADDGMRRVSFGLPDRAVLIPAELAMWGRIALLVAAGLLLLSGLSAHGYSLAAVRTTGMTSAAMVLGLLAAAAILGPLLLPWLPGRAFSIKGAILGVLLVIAIAALGLHPWRYSGGWTHAAAWVVLAPVIASFTVMNFTGATTFTSLSGVLREMRVAVPLQIAGAVIGLALWVLGLFMGVRMR